MYDIVIHAGDTLPLIQKKLYLGGQLVDLTGYSVDFIVNKVVDGTEIFNRDATVVNPPTNGTVQYQWTDADTTAVGTNDVFAHFFAQSGGSKFTIPNHRPLSLLVTTNTNQEYSYSGDPTARPLDRVRFLLSDTNMDQALFTDNEILFVLDEYSNAYSAAEELALVQSSKFTNYADKTVGPLSINYGSVAQRWITLANQLRARRRRSAGGGAVAILTQKVADPYFRTGMMDNLTGLANDNPEALLGEEEL